MFKNKGFSLIEILLVVGIAAGIFGLSAPFALRFYHTQLVEDVRSNVIDALQRARHNAILQKNDSKFGVHFADGSYTLFQGNSYVTRDETQDEIFPVISEITLTGTEDIIFSKLTGAPNYASITVSYGDILRGIYVETSGVISKIDTVDGVEVITATYTITFDANTGSGSMTPQTIDSGVTANLTANSFTKTGYTFDNWSTLDGATTYADGASYTMGTADITLYAQWDINPVAPGAPTIGVATAGNATSSVTFTAPASNGGSVITSYTVTSSPGGLTGTGSASPITVTGLTNGTAYTFTVTATNAVGTGSASSASNSVVPDVVASGLVSFWPFTGNANDIVGTNNGTVTGATLTTGVKGVANTAYSFDGNDYVSVADSATIEPGSVFTFSAWIYQATSVGGGRTIFNKWASGGGPIFHTPVGDGTNLKMFFTGDGADYAVTSGLGLVANTWYHAVVVYNGAGSTNADKMKIYVNGANQTLTFAGANVPISFANNTYAFKIGRWDELNYNWNGSIDNVRIYNRALTAGEITAIYNEEKPDATVPGTPTIGTATAGNATSSVTFTAPASDGNSAITSYTVTSSPGGLTGTGSASPITATGLTNGTAYTFTVTATNAIGTSTASSASNSVTPTGIPVSGLVSYWPFTGNANDVVGTNNGTVTGATLTTGVKEVANTAYSFDGGDIITSTDTSLPLGSNARTITAWVKTTLTTEKYFFKYGNIATNQPIAIGIRAGSPVMTQNGGGKSCTAVFNDNNWHFLVYQINGSDAAIYVDGVNKTIATEGTWSVNTVLNSLKIGGLGSDWSSSYNWTGSIDEVRVYNRVLSAQEITDIYNEEKP